MLDRIITKIVVHIAFSHFLFGNSKILNIIFMCKSHAKISSVPHLPRTVSHFEFDGGSRGYHFVRYVALVVWLSVDFYRLKIGRAHV